MASEESGSVSPDAAEKVESGKDVPVKETEQIPVEQEHPEEEPAAEAAAAGHDEEENKGEEAASPKGEEEKKPAEENTEKPKEEEEKKPAEENTEKPVTEEPVNPPTEVATESPKPQEVAVEQEPSREPEEEETVIIADEPKQPEEKEPEPVAEPEQKQDPAPEQPQPQPEPEPEPEPEIPPEPAPEVVEPPKESSPPVTTSVLQDASAPISTKSIPQEAYSDPLAFPADYVEEEEPVAAPAAAPVAAPQVEIPQVAAPQVEIPQVATPQVAAPQVELPEGMMAPVPKVSVPSGLFLPSNLPSDLPDSGVPFYTNPVGLLDIPDIPAAQIVEAPVVAANPIGAAPTTPQIASPQVASPQVAAPVAAAPVTAAPVAAAPVAAAPAVDMPDIKVLGEKKVGKTTRYWDCCKPSCAWSGKASVSSPVSTCSASGSILSDPDAKSGCDGGESYMCTDQQPWAVNDQLSYGFAAASISGESESTWCCACYRLTFTSTSIAGKQLIVQVTNTGGDLGENHFDLQMPGGGLGIFDGCSSQFGVDADSWGERYGGLSDVSECAKLPASLQAGCEWRFGWFENADNPEMEFEEVECPAEIVKKTGCSRL